MKISEMNEGHSINEPLVVLSTNARKTKAGKDYLVLTLFDGTDSIQGNYWDWGGKAMPEKNTILNVAAQVTSYMGKKQLNVKGLVVNHEKELHEFMPSSGHDIGAIYRDAYALFTDIKDELLRSLCLGVLEDFRDLWLIVPGAASIHHAYAAGTLVHSYETVQYAMAIAHLTPEVNMDLVIAGAFLHDFGKLFGYQMNGIVCEKTDTGHLFEHTHMGASTLRSYAYQGLIKSENDADKLDLLLHIILSHHGKVEYGAAVPPAMLEAHIVSTADGLSANLCQIVEASKAAGSAKFTEKLWPLNNIAHLNVSWVQELMQPPTLAPAQVDVEELVDAE